MGRSRVATAAAPALLIAGLALGPLLGLALGLVVTSPAHAAGTQVAPAHAVTAKAAPVASVGKRVHQLKRRVRWPLSGSAAGTVAAKPRAWCLATARHRTPEPVPTPRRHDALSNAPPGGAPA